MTPEEQIAQGVRWQRKEGFIPGVIVVARDIFPFGYPKTIEGVVVQVEPAAPPGFWACIPKNAPGTLGWHWDDLEEET